MSLHGFLDESRRGSTYLVAVVLVHPRDLDRMRSGLRRLVKAGQRRIHFAKESDARRREVVSLLHGMGLRARVWSIRHPDDVAARQVCLTAVARRLHGLGIARLALESCQHQDARDRRTFAAVLGKAGDAFTYEHLRPAEDPLLWVSDAVAWCYGAGGDWRRRVSPMLDDVTCLN